MMSTMERSNRIEVSHVTAAMYNEQIQSNSLSEQFQKRKRLWIIISIFIVVALFILTSAIIIWNQKHQNREETSITAISTVQTSNPTRETTIIDDAIAIGINVNTKWKAEATTVAGGNGQGSELNQLRIALSIDIDDDDESIYITDSSNDRIMKWKLNGTRGEIAAGGNGKGKRLDQLDEPCDAIVEKTSHSLVICDRENRRVIKWILGNKTGQQVIIANITCWGLAWDSIGDLYVSDWANHQIIRWKQVHSQRTVVAGGNGPGAAFNQLNRPQIIFVDQFGFIYIADYSNARIMKWEEDEREGNLLVDFSTITNYDDRDTLFASVFVDLTGNVYFSDENNCHISRWSSGTHKGKIIAGGDGCHDGVNALSGPNDFGFDQQGNLYVVDGYNNRIQKFARDLH